jgi:hypothetical protein
MRTKGSFASVCEKPIQLNCDFSVEYLDVAVLVICSVGMHVLDEFE